MRNFLGEVTPLQTSLTAVFIPFVTAGIGMYLGAAIGDGLFSDPVDGGVIGATAGLVGGIVPTVFIWSGDIDAYHAKNKPRRARL